ncbi:MAG TPA: hypothetical protein VGQ93_02465 [Lysobacter sp.]|nr:hypothetical protein [Lysobacter sp.]
MAAVLLTTLVAGPAWAEIVFPVQEPPPLPAASMVEMPASPVSAAATTAATPPGGADAVVPAALPSAESPAPDTLAPTAPPEPNIRWPGAPQPTAEIVPAPEETGDPTELLARGLRAYLGGDGQPDYERAARVFKAAADAGDVRGAMAFAYLQTMGLGVARDLSAARARLQQASAAGIVRADYLLSLLEALDKRPQSPQRAATLRESAARRGDSVAENAMGVHYQLQGERVTAELWYQRAAEHGSSSAVQNLANLARSEVVKEQVATTTRTAESGQADADALFVLAQRYHRGDGVPLDYAQALRMYRAAAAKGSEAARQMLGLIQSRPNTDGQIDPAWMRELATANVGAANRKQEAPAALTVAVPKNDDPLSGLTEIAPIKVSPIRGPPIKVPPIKASPDPTRRLP